MDSGYEEEEEREMDMGEKRWMREGRKDTVDGTEG